jgi:hypothetical protein
VKPFLGMESLSQNIRTSPEDDASARCPVLRLLMVTDKGMVFESSTSYAIGCSVEMAVHLQALAKTKRTAARQSQSKSEFLTSEGLVVSCTSRAGSAGSQPVYEITLLFSCLHRQDKRKLRHLVSRYRRSTSLPESGGEAATLGGASLPEQVLGLN